MNNQPKKIPNKKEESIHSCYALEDEEEKKTKL